MKPGKIVLIPDSFKGTLSSVEVCRVLRGCVECRLSGCEVRAIPVADGGEGSVDAFLAALGGEKVHARVAGPFFEPVESFYGLTDGGKTAIVERAACAGLPLAGERRDPALTTTYGVGELIALAVEGGARKIILGLGGSATNDAGCGAAAALGVRFFDRTGTPFVPTGGTLGEVERIDVSAARERPRLATDALILFTEVASRLSLLLSLVMMAATVAATIYTVVIYLSGSPVAGWTTTMLFLGFGFFGMFAILTLILKYLSILVDLTFKRQKYVFESIEKISK